MVVKENSDMATTPRRSTRERKRMRQSFNSAQYVSAAEEERALHDESANTEVTSPSPIRGNVSKKRRTSTVKTKTKDMSVSRINDENQILNNCDGIIREVMDSKAAIAPIISSWRKAYARDASKSIAEFITFILNACGCNETVSVEMLEQDHKHIVKKLQKKNEDSETMYMYPLHSKRIEFRKFGARLTQTIDIFVKAVQHDSLIRNTNDNHDDALVTVVRFVVELSRCNMRSLRHTASFIAFALLSSILSVVDIDRQQLSIRTQQLNAEKGKKRRKPMKRDSETITQLTNDITELQQRIDIAQQFIDQLFNDVFVARYRDTWSTLSALSITSLRSWVMQSKSFVDDQVFKYFGWSLSSADSSNRIVALQSISEFVGDDSIRPQLSNFLQRFISRIIAMHNDIDNTVSAAAIDTCSALLVHDDILHEHDSFGEVAPLIWDNSVRVRAAAAHHVYEDSFVVDDDKDIRARMLEDIEQLYTLFVECAPKMTDTDIDDEEFVVAHLVDAFFFRLDGLRAWDTLSIALLEGEDGTTSSAERTAMDAKNRQFFLARCILACTQLIHHQLPVESIHPKKMKKTQLCKLMAAQTSCERFVKDTAFIHLFNVFQSDENVLSCLCRVFTICPLHTLNVAPLISTMVTCFAKSTHYETLRHIVMALQHANADQQLHDAAVRLKTSFDDLQADNDGTDEVMMAISMCIARVRALCVCVDVSELVDSTDFDTALKLGCDARDFDTHDNQWSEHEQQTMANLLSVTTHNLMWLCVRATTEGASDAEEGSVLASQLTGRTSILTSTCQTLLHERSPLQSDASKALGCISIIGIGNTHVRSCTPASLYEQFELCLQKHLDDESNEKQLSSSTLLLLQSAASISRGYIPNASVIPSLVVSQFGVRDKLVDFLVKSVINFFKGKQLIALLAQTILNALKFVFEVSLRQNCIGRIKESARRLSVLFGAATTHQRIDILVCEGIDFALSGDSSLVQFASLALTPFILRCNAQQASIIIEHINKAVRIKTMSTPESDSIPDLDDLIHLCTKRIQVTNRKQKLNAVLEEQEKVLSEEINENVQEQSVIESIETPLASDDVCDDDDDDEAEEDDTSSMPADMNMAE